MVGNLPVLGEEGSWDREGTTRVVVMINLGKICVLKAAKGTSVMASQYLHGKS